MDKNVSKAFEQIIEELKSLELLFKNKRLKDLINYSRLDVIVRKDVLNIDVIWKRFLKERADSMPLDLLYWRMIKKNNLSSEEKELMQTTQSKIASLDKFIRVDFLSLFIFMDIYLSKLIELGETVWGYNINGLNTRSFTKFVKSLESKNCRNQNVNTIYVMFGEDMKWIENTLGFYRDKFIMHPRGAYQEYFGKGLMVPSIDIEHIKYNFDNKKNVENINIFIKKVIGKFPELESMEDYREKVYYLSQKLYLIENPKLRNEAENIILSVGFKSPNIFNVARIVLKFSLDFIRYLKHLVRANDAPYGMIKTEYE